MASNTAATDTVVTYPASTAAPTVGDAARIAQWIVSPLASLRLTVALFAMAILIIFIGTLAQVDKDMWEVMDDYFRAWIAWVDFQLFFPRSWFPRMQAVPGGFYFPGGAMIGFVMIINLLAAHTLRFRIQVKGSRLGAGLLVLAGGVVISWLVVNSGHNPDGFQRLVEEHKWSMLWSAIMLGLVAVWCGALYGLLRLDRSQVIQWWALACVCVGLGGLLAWLFYQGDGAALSDSSMRILWQLILGTVAGLVLLGGCVLLFKKRAGIVLLHGGVGLMMLGEFLVSKYAVEERITIVEGQAANFARDIRSVELAIVDSSHPDHDDVVVIPESMLARQGVIQHEDLPFDVAILPYFKNSVIRPVKPEDPNLATAGKGLQFIAEEARGSSGTDSSGRVDEASLYARLTKKGSSEEIGTYLLSQVIGQPHQNAIVFDEKITVDDRTYDVSLRFKRNYKPYSLRLIDVRKDDYLGTDTPRNYSSLVQLADASRNVDRKINIWMNNPLRYAGETFYQSGYTNDRGTEITDLQVVTNAGWMIPYTACMIVAIGMLFHFSVTLIRFLNRRSSQVEDVTADPVVARQQPDKDRRRRKSAPADTTVVAASTAKPDGFSKMFPWAVLAVAAVAVILLAVRARPTDVSADTMNLHTFGKLPLVFQGRVKPFDTLARNSMRIISNRQSFKDESGKRQPAIRWLLDTISGSEEAEKHKVFRIENLEVLETLGLKRRKGYRYSVEEFRDRIGEFERQVDQARRLDPAELTTYQRKVLELDKRIRTFTLLWASFRPLPIPAFPTKEEYDSDPEKTKERMVEIKQWVDQIPAAQQRLAVMQPPLAVPLMPEDGEGSVDGDGDGDGRDEDQWLPFATAWDLAYIPRAMNEAVNPATISLHDILEAYRTGDVRRFNTEVAKYQAALEWDPPAQVSSSKTNFESFFNHFQPFMAALLLYVVAFTLAAAAWLGWSRPLNRSALWLIFLAFFIHTFALVARMYISGRPPVTNLYSSAVFIGWGCVILGMILELIFRLGIGNVVAASAGFATLLIAHYLAGDGDTFVVLQAVLDTQFWLSTHVTCITFGYATTFLAGLLGLVYILLGALTRVLSRQAGKELVRMIYGTLCFSIFFSFVGTVLGGLWADDSWGRFWGWDPKENGALIIVLWNALVLHARWGAMVKERGLAILAVGGNIVTSWSWFGVNELGVGLHSYGFTEGVLLALGLFIASQLAIMCVGLLPLSLWLSFRQKPQHGLE